MQFRGYDLPGRHMPHRYLSFVTTAVGGAVASLTVPLIASMRREEGETWEERKKWSSSSSTAAAAAVGGAAIDEREGFIIVLNWFERWRDHQSRRRVLVLFQHSESSRDHNKILGFGTVNSIESRNPGNKACALRGLYPINRLPCRFACFQWS